VLVVGVKYYNRQQRLIGNFEHSEKCLILTVDKKLVNKVHTVHQNMNLHLGRSVEEKTFQRQ